MIEIVAETVRKNVSATATAADGLARRRGWTSRQDTGKLHVAVAVWEHAVYLGASRRPTASAHACRVRPPPSHAMMTKAKTNGTTQFIPAKTEAHRQGFDEALLLDASDTSRKPPGANLFVVRGKYARHAGADSILKHHAIEFLRSRPRSGPRGARGPHDRDHLYVATRSRLRHRAEIVGIRRSTTGDRTGKTGPVTMKLREAYERAVRGSPNAQRTGCITADALTAQLDYQSRERIFPGRISRCRQSQPLVDVSCSISQAPDRHHARSRHSVGADAGSGRGPRHAGMVTTRSSSRASRRTETGAAGDGERRESSAFPLRGVRRSRSPTMSRRRITSARSCRASRSTRYISVSSERRLNLLRLDELWPDPGSGPEPSKFADVHALARTDRMWDLSTSMPGTIALK